MKRKLREINSYSLQFHEKKKFEQTWRRVQMEKNRLELSLLQQNETSHQLLTKMATRSWFPSCLSTMTSAVEIKN